MEADGEEFEKMDVMVDNDTELPIEDAALTQYQIPYESWAGYDITLDCKNLSTKYQYNEYSQKQRLHKFLDQLSISHPNVGYVGIKNLSAKNSELIPIIWNHFLKQRRRRHEGTVHTTLSLDECEISSLFDLNIKATNNDSISTIQLFDCFVSNDNVSNNCKRDEIQRAIEKCTDFTRWKILDCKNNKDLIFLLNALTRNNFIQHLHISCWENRLPREVMIINSITNLVSNNKNLSSLKLDFNDYPVNFSSADAITELANALINSKTITDLILEDICLRDTERKMLCLIMKHGKFKRFELITSMIWFVVLDNNRKIEFDIEGSTNEKALNLLMNDISINLPDLKKIEIDRCIDSGCRRIIDNSELLNTILLHFARYNNSIQTVVLGLGLLPAIFQDHSFYNTINDGKSIVSSKITLELKFKCCDDDCHDIAVIGTAIEKFCLFSSWRFQMPCENCEKTTYILNALSRNKYIQSLHFCAPSFGMNEMQFNDIVNSITDVVNNTKTLSKLVLDFTSSKLNSTATAAVTNLAEALIKSETINDLSLYSFHFECMESFQSIHSIFERKTNLYRLSMDSSLFSWMWAYKKHCFDASIFYNQFQNHMNSTLRELDLEYYEKGPEAIKQMLLFLALLKDSHLEKLSFKTNYATERTICFSKSLFVDTIPFMSRLSYFKYITNSFKTKHLREKIVQGIATCNRTLVNVYFSHETKEQQSGKVKCNQMFVKSTRRFLQRNNAISACIENKAYITNLAFPKTLFTSKPTGPDAVFQLLCNLGLEVGMKENTSGQPTSKVNTTTTKTKTTTDKRKRTCTL